MVLRFSRRAAVAAAVGALLAGVFVSPVAAQAAAATSSYGSSINGDPADIYYPQTSGSHAVWPVVLVLQGANVDKGFYSSFASKVAAYGFVVAVPNHTRTVSDATGLFTDALEANWTVSWAAAENARAGSPLKGAIDTGTLLLAGHSFGGATGLSVSTGLTITPFTSSIAIAPRQLKAAAFYGTNNAIPDTSLVLPVLNTVPVALIQGSVDGMADPSAGLATYYLLAGRPKLYVSVTGANHYGITNVQSPAGAIPEPATQTLAQATGVDTIARWTAQFLLAQLGNTSAKIYVYGTGDAADSNVETKHLL
jgi:predicted dienelactone hydrolase